MNFITLRITCHSNVFILCTETGIAQSLQLLGYLLYNQGNRVPFRLSQRFFYKVSRFFVAHRTSNPLVAGAISLGVKRPGLQA